ncbi:transposase family protein [Bacillus suaedaesalsae]|uniref:Transposase n=1 Tax=Bacillus suaedaesalsae TaxID=2810349 RepID=A0ABS2DKR8_9BACI|nr:transposase [Bacillus suaedaesalsae]
MHTHFITTLLDIEEIEVYQIEETNTHLEIYVGTPVKDQVCPCCHEMTSSVHDYRTQRIRDLKLREKYCFLFLQKRRYRCSSCGKRFYEEYSFFLNDTKGIRKGFFNLFY